MELLLAIAIGFALGWASAWFVQCIPLLKDTTEEEIDYNMMS